MLSAPRIAQYDAGATGGSELGAEFLGRRAVVVGNGDDVAPRPAHARYHLVQHNRLAVADQGSVALLHIAVDFPRLAFGQMRGDLDAPARHVRRDLLRLLLRRQNEIGEPRARHALRDGGVGVRRRRRRSPFVRGPAGDDGDIVAGLARQRARARDPFTDTAGPGIVAGGGETKVAEFFAQLAQIARRMLERLDWIERIGKPMPIRGAGHELRDASGALSAHGERVEPALLPDDAGEELDRQAILRSIFFNRAADIFRSGRILHRVLLRCRRRRAGLRVGAGAEKRDRAREHDGGETSHCGSTRQTRSSAERFKLYECAALSLSAASTSSSAFGSSMVAGIVQLSPSTIFFMVPRRILPERVFGSRATVMARLNAATGPIFSRTNATHSCSISVGGRLTPVLSTMKPHGTSPLSSSLMPSTAHSATS